MSEDKLRATRLRSALSGVERKDLGSILDAAVDLALIIDEDGRIYESLPGSGTGLGEAADWEGRLWSEVVTNETRPKVRALIEEGFSQGVPRFRQVNHQLADGNNVPVGFTTVRLGGGKRLIAVGRSLKALADLQRRLVEAQQTMESEYWHVRQAEARYRLLFQQSREPIFLVDAGKLEITDVNNAGAGLAGTDTNRLVGRSFPLSSFRFGRNGNEDAARQEFMSGLQQVASGTANSFRAAVRVGESDFPWVVNLSLVRFAQQRILLVRMETEQGFEAGSSMGLDILDLLDRAPDGFVVADMEGHILVANEAFVQMTQAAGAAQLEGKNVSLWFGRPGADLTVLLTQLERSGQVRQFNTTVTGDHGLDTEVEISAVSASNAEQPAMALVFRDVSRRLANQSQPSEDIDQAVERLTDRVGQVSLKQLVEDTVSLVELHFIDAALQLTGDNRSAAAELLGLSRQSLYTKLKRYGLDEREGSNGAR